jgi:hypothetical protein
MTNYTDDEIIEAARKALTERGIYGLNYIFKSHIDPDPSKAHLLMGPVREKMAELLAKNTANSVDWFCVFVSYLASQKTEGKEYGNDLVAAMTPDLFLEAVRQLKEDKNFQRYVELILNIKNVRELMAAVDIQTTAQFARFGEENIAEYKDSGLSPSEDPYHMLFAAQEELTNHPEILDALIPADQDIVRINGVVDENNYFKNVSPNITLVFNAQSGAMEIWTDCYDEILTIDELAAHVADEDDSEYPDDDELKRIWATLNNLVSDTPQDNVAIMSRNLERLKQHAAKQLAECKYRPV